MGQLEPDFIPGMRLSALVYDEVVRPLLDEFFPGLPHAAALLGTGSEVLGFDTARSTDHEWGPRLQLLLASNDVHHAAPIDAMLRQRLPATFRGYSTHFGPPDEEGTRLRANSGSGPVDHKIEVTTLGELTRQTLGLVVEEARNADAATWLVLPQQRLLSMVAGAVFHDGLGELTALRGELAWYPDDVWRYLLACQWQRISQQEPIVGRTAEVGDELGSRLIAATLVGDAMRLAFLMERRYAPYTKWFGTAFALLPSAAHLAPLLEGALHATSFPERECHLCAALTLLAQMHNELGLTSSPPTTPTHFHTRPFLVIHGEIFANALVGSITESAMRRIVDRVGLIGSIDQISDNVDLLTRPPRFLGLRALYEGSGPAPDQPSCFP